jgi:hypothetical protein
MAVDGRLRQAIAVYGRRWQAVVDSGCGLKEDRDSGLRGQRDQGLHCVVLIEKAFDELVP